MQKNEFEINEADIEMQTGWRTGKNSIEKSSI